MAWGDPDINSTPSVEFRISDVAPLSSPWLDTWELIPKLEECKRDRLMFKSRTNVKRADTIPTRSLEGRPCMIIFDILLRCVPSQQILYSSTRHGLLMSAVRCQN